MDDLIQQDVTKMLNHINGLTRASLNNATPYDLAHILLDNEVFEKNFLTSRVFAMHFSKFFFTLIIF